jgi:O-antigen/teichoic acid export membrane protein
MPRFFMIYLLPAGLINLGNVFGYLFQLTIARTLPVAEVGAFSAIFALTNVASAPAAILPLAISRTMIQTENVEGAAGSIIFRSALTSLLITAAILSVGAVLIEPLRAVLRVDRQSTVILALLLTCSNMLYCLAIGWLQGKQRYISSSLVLASIPALRCLFGIWLVAGWGGGVDAAVTATALPGAILFVVCVAMLYKRNDRQPSPLPAGTWRDFGHFLLLSSASSLLLFGFWNLDVVAVRAMFSPEASGLYAVAAVLARIAYLLPIAGVNVLFSEATRAGLDSENSERAARRVLFHNFVFAAALGLVAAVPLSLFAEPVLAMFGGAAYAASAAVLRVLSFVMALLAILQVVVTYMLARHQYQVLWLLAAGLAAFLLLARLCARNELDVVEYLGITIAALVVAGLLLALRKPGRGGVPTQPGEFRARDEITL